MTIATMMATPSTQSTGGSLAGRGVPKSWKNPRARDTMAEIVRITYTERAYLHLTYAGKRLIRNKLSFLKYVSSVGGNS